MKTDSRGKQRRRWRPRRRYLAVATVIGGLVLASTVSASAAPVHGTMSGEAYGVTASVGLLGNPEGVLLSKVPDTGLITTTETSTTTPSCVDVPAGLLVIHALCDSVTTHAYTSRVTAKAEVADLVIRVPGLPVIALRGVKAWSSVSCDSSHGTTTVAFLKIGGNNVISRRATFSNGATLTIGPIKIVFDETVKHGPPTRARLVNAVHISAHVPNIADLDVIVSSAFAGVTDCASTGGD